MHMTRCHYDEYNSNVLDFNDMYDRATHYNTEGSVCNADYLLMSADDGTRNPNEKSNEQSVVRSADHRLHTLHVRQRKVILHLII